MNRTPIKKHRTKPRRGPLRDPKYRKWLRDTRICAVCAILIAHKLAYKIPNNWASLWPEAAHTENNGTSSKGPDSSCVPLCRTHHAEYDADRKAFEAKYGVDMKAIAKEHWERYQRELSN